MSIQISISHITCSGKETKHKNSYDEKLYGSKPRTIGQMFFQPYGSLEEYVHSAKHTILPIAIIAGAVWLPHVMMLLCEGEMLVYALFVIVAGGMKLFGDDINASFLLNAVERCIERLCQTFIDLVLLPLTLLQMFTRGTSTALHAVGILKAHKEPEEHKEHKEPEEPEEPEEHKEHKEPEEPEEHKEHKEPEEPEQDEQDEKYPWGMSID